MGCQCQMIYDDTHLYVALPKCGSTFVHTYLQRECGWPSVSHAPFGSWHHRPLCLAPESVRAGRDVFSVMRSPWAWYRSLYYSEPRKMAGWETGKHHDFGSWLRLVLDGQAHPFLPMHHRIDVQLFTLMGWADVGPLTCNYLIMCGIDPGQFVRRKDAPDKVDIGIQHWLRTESLSSDLADYLGLDNEAISKEPHVNTCAERAHATGYSPGHYSQDYTQDLAQLVGHKDRLICERFGYRFEKP